MTRIADLRRRMTGPGRGRAAALIALLLLIVLAAWYQGGERTVGPIEVDVPVPEGAL